MAAPGTLAGAGGNHGVSRRWSHPGSGRRETRCSQFSPSRQKLWSQQTPVSPRLWPEGNQMLPVLVCPSLPPLPWLFPIRSPSPCPVDPAVMDPRWRIPPPHTPPEHSTSRFRLLISLWAASDPPWMRHALPEAPVAFLPGQEEEEARLREPHLPGARVVALRLRCPREGSSAGSHPPIWVLRAQQAAAGLPRNALPITTTSFLPTGLRAQASTLGRRSKSLGRDHQSL